MSSDLIMTRQRDHIFEIILNRPEKRNALNREHTETTWIEHNNRSIIF